MRERECIARIRQCDVCFLVGEGRRAALSDQPRLALQITLVNSRGFRSPPSTPPPRDTQMAAKPAPSRTKLLFLVKIKEMGRSSTTVFD